LLKTPGGTLWPLVVALYVRVMERFSMAKSKLTVTVRLRISPEDLAQEAAAEDRSISSCLRLLAKAGMSAAGSEQQQAAQGRSMKNALTISRGDTFEAALTKARTERTAAEGRIAELEAKRAAQLETDDIAAIDQTDIAIAAERRAIAICDQRIAVIERELRQQEKQRREGARTAAIKVIAGIFAKRTAKGARLEELLVELVTLANDIKNDEHTLRAAWPFDLPHWFTWQLYDFGRDVLVSLRRACEVGTGSNWMPSDVRVAIGGWVGSSGFTEAPKPGPRAPDDLPGKLAHNAQQILKTLCAVDIHPAEPLAKDDAEAA
jgi:hypothetical protein